MLSLKYKRSKWPKSMRLATDRLDLHPGRSRMGILPPLLLLGPFRKYGCCIVAYARLLSFFFFFPPTFFLLPSVSG